MKSTLSKAKKSGKTSAKKSAKKTSAKKGQKATTIRAKKAAEPTAPTPEAHNFMSPEVDPAHSPGHKKMNMKEAAQPRRPMGQIADTKAAEPRRTPMVNRRIIGKASVGKASRASANKQ